jgi:hypothetical protein
VLTAVVGSPGAQNLGWSSSHVQDLDDSSCGLDGISNGRMQQMRDSRPAAKNLQDRGERNVNTPRLMGPLSGDRGRFREKALNFRDRPVLVKVVMPAIGKAHEALGLVGERKQALAQRDRDDPVPGTV